MSPKLVKLLPGESLNFCATTFWHGGFTGPENGPRLYVLYSEEHVSVKLKAEIIEAAKKLHVSDSDSDSDSDSNSDSNSNIDT